MFGRQQLEKPTKAVEQCHSIGSAGTVSINVLQKEWLDKLEAPGAHTQNAEHLEVIQNYYKRHLLLLERLLYDYRPDKSNVIIA